MHRGRRCDSLQFLTKGVLNTWAVVSMQVVTYKWLARHFGVSASLAKQLLFAFFEAHRSSVAATYFLSGWTKLDTGGNSSGQDGSGGSSGGGDGGRRHVAQLVDAARLESRQSELAEVTSLHVYSVQPAQPKVRFQATSSGNSQHVALKATIAVLGQSTSLRMLRVQPAQLQVGTRCYGTIPQESAPHGVLSSQSCTSQHSGCTTTAQSCAHRVASAQLQGNMLSHPRRGCRIFAHAAIQDTAELWNTDHVQMEELFAKLLKGGSGAAATDSGCVPGVALSAVACEAAVGLLKFSWPQARMSNPTLWVNAAPWLCPWCDTMTHMHGVTSRLLLLQIAMMCGLASELRQGPGSCKLKHVTIGANATGAGPVKGAAARGCGPAAAAAGSGGEAEGRHACRRAGGCEVRQAAACRCRGASRCALPQQELP